jgi:hypothetical protein
LVFLSWTIGLPVAALGDSINSTYTHVAAGAGTGTLTVTVTTSTTTWDGLQIRCRDDDVAANFTVVAGAGGWAKHATDPIITKEGKKFLQLVRTAGEIASDDSVTVTHTGAKRGGKAAIEAVNTKEAGITKPIKARDKSLVAFGACTIQGSATQCLCDISEDECGLKTGNVYLGDYTACPGDCVPTVSSWGLLVMAVLVLTAATVVMMRRRAMVRGGA